MGERVSTTIVIKPEALAEAKRLASLRRVSMSRLIEQVLEEAIRREQWQSRS